MHARIFVNNIRGNLIIFLLPRFNSERFFRFSSPRAPSPPEHPHPALSLHARSCVRFDVFARGKVRLVGVRSPVGWEMKGRPFSSVCARTYVTHVIMMERVPPQREKEREIEKERNRKRDEKQEKKTPNARTILAGATPESTPLRPTGLFLSR